MTAIVSSGSCTTPASTLFWWMAAAMLPTGISTNVTFFGSTPALARPATSTKSCTLRSEWTPTFLPARSATEEIPESGSVSSPWAVFCGASPKTTCGPPTSRIGAPPVIA
ncbi:MAG: hypothetical protein U1F37_11295 [Alphaproteobacteria bacterium]